MVTHEQKRILIEESLEKLQDAHTLDERQTLTVEKWTAWYDATIPLVTDIKIIAGAMEVEMAKRRGMQLETEAERRGGDQQSKVVPGSTLLSQAVKDQRRKDRVLGRQPAAVDAYIQSEAKAGRIPTRKGARRHIQRAESKLKRKATILRPTPLKTAEDQYRTRIYTALETLADGQRRSDVEVGKITKMKTLDTDFYRRIRLIPWLLMDRTREGMTFTIDHELREICEGRRARPEIGDFTWRGFYQHLRAEITRRRKEAHDLYRAANWRHGMIHTQHQSELLDWIEEELNRIP
jgi:hypothetical protein